MKKNQRKGVADVVGAVIIAAVILTVVIAYFGFEINAKASLNQADHQMLQLNQQAKQESLSVVAYPDANSFLNVNITNRGSSTITVTTIAVGDVNPASVISVSSSLNYGINSGASKNVNTGVQYGGNPLWAKVETSIGTVALALYPQPTNVNSSSGGGALTALTAGGIGDIYLIFQTYSWHPVVNSVTDPSCTSSSGYCMLDPGHPGFAMYSQNATEAAYAVQMVNLNPLHLTITLDNFTSLLQFWGVGSSFRTALWFIASNQSTNILGSYVPVVLPFNVTKTVLFTTEAICRSNNCYPVNTYSPEILQGANVAPVGLASTFIFAHGWKNEPITATENYGQNLPFVTTLFKNSSDILITSTSCTGLQSTSITTTTVTATTTSTQFTTYPTTTTATNTITSPVSPPLKTTITSTSTSTSLATSTGTQTSTLTSTSSGTSTYTNTTTFTTVTQDTTDATTTNVTTTIISTNVTTSTFEDTTTITTTIYTTTTITSTSLSSTTYSTTIRSTTLTTTVTSTPNVTSAVTTTTATTTVTSPQTYVLTSTSCTTSTSVF